MVGEVLIMRLFSVHVLDAGWRTFAVYMSESTLFIANNLPQSGWFEDAP